MRPSLLPATPFHRMVIEQRFRVEGKSLPYLLKTVLHGILQDPRGYTTGTWNGVPTGSGRVLSLTVQERMRCIFKSTTRGRKPSNLPRAVEVINLMQFGALIANTCCLGIEVRNCFMWR